MTSRTIYVPANQTSPVFLVSAGERVTTTGTGKIQYTLSGIVDIGNNLATWIDWTNGTTAGYDDAVVALYCRAVATTAMNVFVTDADTALDGLVAKDGIYWKSQGLTSAQAAALAVPGLTVGSTSAATANTAAMQAAFDIGGRVLSASQGVVNFYGGSKTYTIRSRGLDDGGVTWMPNYGAGSTYNFPGDNSDVPVDLTKIARLAGSQVKAVANAGTILANNVCTCDATGAANSWKQNTNTALTY